MFKTILTTLQIVVPILLAILILLQQRGTALGSAFGGSGGGFYAKRRGLDQKIFTATIILAILFVIIAILSLIIA